MSENLWGQVIVAGAGLAGVALGALTTLLIAIWQYKHGKMKTTIGCLSRDVDYLLLVEERCLNELTEANGRPFKAIKDELRKQIRDETKWSLVHSAARAKVLMRDFPIRS